MLTIRPDSYENPTQVYLHPPDLARKYIGVDRWPVADYEMLLKKLDALALAVDPFPRELLAFCKHCYDCREQKMPKEEILRERISPYLWDTVAEPYQRNGVRFLVQRQGRGYNSMAPGTGKSIQAIMMCLYYPSHFPVVIVCPSIAKLTWEDELRKWFLPALFSSCFPSHAARIVKLIDQYAPFVTVLKSTKTLPFSTRHHFTIISYDLLIRKPAFEYVAQKVKARTLLVDEAHYIKHERSQRTKQVCRLAKRCDHVLPMSGTPLLRCHDLYSQLHALYPEFFNLFFYRNHESWLADRKNTKEHRKAFRFADYFCGGAYRQQRVRDKLLWLPWTGGYLRQDVLYGILNAHVLIQGKQETVLKDSLKPIIRQRYVLEPPAETVPFHAKRITDRNILKTYLFEAYHQLAKTKALLIPTFLGSFLQQDEMKGKKTLIWAHHHVVLDAVQDFLDAKGIGYIRIDGTVASLSERQKLKQAFETHEQIPFAILSISACCTALNLQVACVNIFAEMSFDVFQVRQAENRCNRKGQTKQCYSLFVMARDSMDSLLWAANEKLYRQATMVTQGAEDFFLSVYREFAEQGG